MLHLLLYIPLFICCWAVYRASKSLRANADALWTYKHLTPRTSYTNNKITDLEANIIMCRLTIVCGIAIAVGSLVVLVIYS